MKTDGCASGGENRILFPDSLDGRPGKEAEGVGDMRTGKQQEGRRMELRAALCERLDKLRRNLELYPRQVLKTVYKKGYEALSGEIRVLLAEYTAETAFRGFCILKSDAGEISSAVSRAVQNSGVLAEISTAAYEHQDIDEIDRLAGKIRRLAETALESFFPRYICLYLKEECFANPPASPEVWNLLTGCVWQDGRWVRKEWKNK